jgi:hypothetical protein
MLKQAHGELTALQMTKSMVKKSDLASEIFSLSTGWKTLMPLISPQRLFKINIKLSRKKPPNLQFFNGDS